MIDASLSDASTPPDDPSVIRARRFELTAEQHDTCHKLERLLGKAVSDRYVDFCRLSADAFDLRVPSPLAGHALRELDSILRQTLGAPFEAAFTPSEGEIARIRTAENLLTGLGFDEDAISRATKGLQPQVSHKDQIRKIVVSLGLAEDGDIASAWITVSAAHKKAHERPFNRALKIDDEFRTEWSDPFHMVIRGIAVQLEGRFTALTTRVEELAGMADKARALSLYEKEIPGALSLQWHFFRKIDGPGWLPELLSRGLISEPMPYPEEDTRELKLRQWPVGQYLLRMAKSDDAATRSLVVFAIRLLAKSNHPDVQRDGLEIIKALPASEAAKAIDLAIGWISENEFFGAHIGEEIMADLAHAGERDACLKLAIQLYRLAPRDKRVTTHFSQHMYEHSLFKRTPLLTTTLGLDALSMLCGLLQEAALITEKIVDDPPADYTSFSSIPLPRTEMDQHDVYGALTAAVLRCTIQLLETEGADGAAVLAILRARAYRIFKRIAMNAVATRPKAVPALADEILFDDELLESESLTEEYAALAKARFPQMKGEDQQKLLAAIDEIPEKYADLWCERFTEYYKRPPDEADEKDYRDATIRNHTWYWREVLPDERREALEQYVKKSGTPDAWRSALSAPEEESPLNPTDFETASAKEIATYLKEWTPDAGLKKQTKTALAYELRKAVQQNPAKFAAEASEFSSLAPLYVRRYFEGLLQAAQDKADLDWHGVLGLIESVVSRAKEPAADDKGESGDDPSGFWAAKQAIEVLRTGLQRGADIIPLEHAQRIQSILKLAEQIAPQAAELADFNDRFARNAYFAAESTLFGLTAEINILFVYWLSKQVGSEAQQNPRGALEASAEVQAFLDRALREKGDKGRIVRAVIGRYFSWLIYFGETWLRGNFSRIFPSDRDLRDAAWSAHLVNDTRPARDFVDLMRPMYEEEITRLRDPKPVDDRDFRQDRCGEYLLVLYLWGVLPEDLLQMLLDAAPDRLKRHLMWFVARDVKSPDISPEIRARGIGYWEMRLEAGVSASNKDEFRGELGSINNWTSFDAGDTDWLIAQQIKMYRAGFAPNHAYSVVEWAAKKAETRPDAIVEMIEALFLNPRTDHWAYTTQQPQVRTVLVAGLKTQNPTTRERVHRIVSFLASIGETSFLDLIKE